MPKISTLNIHLAGKDAKLCKGHLSLAATAMRRTMRALAGELEHIPDDHPDKQALEYKHDQAAALLQLIIHTNHAADGIDEAELITYEPQPAGQLDKQEVPA